MENINLSDNIQVSKIVLKLEMGPDPTRPKLTFDLQ